VEERGAPGHPSLGLQHAVGNRALAGLLAAGRVQARLRVGPRGDLAEEEAERVAARVTSGPAPGCRCGGACEDCREKERSIVRRRVTRGRRHLEDADFPDDLALPRTGGQPLGPAMRREMEARFGADFGDVRLHLGREAAVLNETLAADAFTLGNGIWLGEGESPSDRLLLAHELTHVVQQTPSRTAAGRDGSAVHVHTGGAVVQRQEHGAGHTGSTLGVPGVSSDKWRSDIEAMYRRTGHAEAARAVRDCRVLGMCARILTEEEAWRAYRRGRITANLGEPRGESRTVVQQPGRAAAAVPLAAPVAARGLATAGESALARAAASWGSAEVLTGGGAAVTETAAATTAASGAVAAATVAVPIAVGVVIAIVDLLGYASFQRALHDAGYVILPEPLGVCIGSCHTAPVPTTPRFPDLPTEPLIPPATTDEEMRRIAEWLSSSRPTPAPTTPPAPAPEPAPREDEDERRRCRLVPRESSRGGDPLSDLFCSLVSGGGTSYDIYSPVGIAEIDALQGDTWYECKCGQVSLVRAWRAGYRWARLALEGGGRSMGLDEQVRRQSRIAVVCGYRYRLVVASDEVAEFFRDRYPFVDVVVVPFEPCE
jgi:hypothetical protein